jgi:hypothetical protein
VLKIRYVSQLLSGHQAEWVTIFKNHIRTGLRHGPLKAELRLWTVQEALLLQPKIVVPSRISRSILAGWYQATTRLRYAVRYHPIAQDFTILYLYCMSLNHGEPFQLEDYRKLKLWTDGRGLQVATDIFHQGTWLMAEELSQRTRATRHVGRPQFIYLMSFVAASPGLTTASVQSASGWYWDTGHQPLEGWTLTSQNWRALSKFQISVLLN